MNGDKNNENENNEFNVIESLEDFTNALIDFTLNSDAISISTKFMAVLIKLAEKNDIFTKMLVKDEWVDNEFADLYYKSKELLENMDEWLSKHNYDSKGNKTL